MNVIFWSAIVCIIFGLQPKILLSTYVNKLHFQLYIWPGSLLGLKLNKAAVGTK